MEDNDSLYIELPPVTQEEIDREFRFIMQFVERGYLDIEDVLHDDFYGLKARFELAI